VGRAESGPGLVDRRLTDRADLLGRRGQVANGSDLAPCDRQPPGRPQERVVEVTTGRTEISRHGCEQVGRVRVADGDRVSVRLGGADRRDPRPDVTIDANGEDDDTGDPGHDEQCQQGPEPPPPGGRGGRPRSVHDFS